jgi:hypothetical protein
MMPDEKFTLEALKLPDDFTPDVAAPVMLRKPHRGHFVKVPMEWRRRLESARLAATYRIALHLLHEDFKAHGRGNKIRLANGALEGVTRCQKSRAIRELEALGLIEIEHRPRKSPVIALLHPDDDE